MGRKEILTEQTTKGRQLVLDRTNDTRLQGLARSIANVQERNGRISLAVIHSKHLEMLQPYVKELEKIFQAGVDLTHLAMLEEAYQWGVDLRWEMLANSDQN
jgi:hypothetical protein